MNKKTIVVALLLAFGLSAVAFAAEPAQTEKTKKFWIMPTVGYRTSGVVEIEPVETSPYTGYRIEDAVTYGLTFGYQISSILAVEAMWSRSNPSVYGTAAAQGETPAVKDFLFKAPQDHLQANLLLSTGYEMGPVKPFFVAGLGVTSVNPEGEPSGFTRFSWSFGMGLDAMINTSFGVRAQGKFSPTYINTIDAVLVEWPGGAQTTSLRNTMTQWEFQAGVFWRF